MNQTSQTQPEINKDLNLSSKTVVQNFSEQIQKACEATEGLRSVSVIFDWSYAIKKAEEPVDGLWGDSVGPLDPRETAALRAQLTATLGFMSHQQEALRQSIIQMAELSESLEERISKLKKELRTYESEKPSGE